MKRAFISYSAADSEAALYITTELRERGVDVFFDYERMMHAGRFNKRMANEIKARDYLLLVQTPEALGSQQVQAEIRYAQEHDVAIIPLQLKTIDLRDTSEFAHLLHTKPIDFTEWFQGKQAPNTLKELEQLLWQETEGAPISISNASKLKELTTLTGHQSWVRKAIFSPDGHFLASCSNDNTVRLWDTRRRDYSHAPPRCLVEIPAHTASVWSIAFSPDSMLLASCGNDNLVRVWGLQDLPEVYQYTLFTDHHEPVYDVVFSKDYRLLASASHDNTVHLRDIANLRNNGRADAIVPLLHTSHAYSVDIAPDSHIIASASRDSTIRVWRIDPDKDLRKANWNNPEILIGHVSWVNTVTFSPLNTVLASTSNDMTIRLWDTTTLECIMVLKGHKDGVNSLAFSPDGRLIASCSKDNTVRLWDIATGKEIAAWEAHLRSVNSVAFSPDGTLLATAAGDNTIKFWGIP